MSVKNTSLGIQRHVHTGATTILGFQGSNKQEQYAANHKASISSVHDYCSIGNK